MSERIRMLVVSRVSVQRPWSLPDRNQNFERKQSESQKVFMELQRERQ